MILLVDALYFDMDGTIAGLYDLDDWLPRLRAKDANVYRDSKPCHDLQKLACVLNKLQKMGLHLGIDSWLSKERDIKLYRESRAAKRRWLQQHMSSVLWDEIHITAYGRAKHLTVKYPKSILIDDTDAVRADWIRHGGIAINPLNISTDELIEKILAAALSK